MSASRDRQIVIELVVRSGHPSLLEGLDAWLQLGLISDDFVRQLGQAELSCALPAVTPAIESDPELLEIPVPIPTAPIAAQSVSRRRRAQPNFLSQALQSFMAEISVVWLLFLGVFLVVVSSGVLAATQWRNVSPLGQYGILFVYTLAFGIASAWTRQHAALQLTSWMLNIATLLLVPVNFWMMDGFGLWRSAVGAGVAAIAALVLTGVTIWLLKRSEARWLIAGVVVLSWLHWGWQQPGVPLIAAYVGTLGASAILLVHDGQQQRVRRAEIEIPPDVSGTVTHATAATALSPIAIALSAMLLIGRALFVAAVPVSQLGLAVGICGWSMSWLSRLHRARLGWSWAGVVLLLVGWLVTVGQSPPWQAIAISGLGLWLLLDALGRTGRSAYLATGFLVGGQLVWLGWRLLPTSWQTQIVAWATNLAGSQAMPLALLGLGFFPYVMVTVGFSQWLRRRDRPHLAQEAEWLSLAFGTLLVVISLGNPLVRSLNLTLASLTLLLVVRDRRPRSDRLVYLTHGVLLSTVMSWIHASLPALMTQDWVGIVLVLMALEWSFSALAGDRWYSAANSAWYLGVILAAVSYCLLWNQPWTIAPLWRLSWLLTPILLTGLSYRDRWPVASKAAGLSVLALVVAQPLMLDLSNIRLASLGLATLLMRLNAYRLQQLFVAVLTVGFGLGFWSCLVWEVGQDRLTFGWGMVWVALTILLLWGIRGLWQSRRSHLASLYSKALDGWAIALLLLAFLTLTLHQFLVFWQIDTATWPVILSGGVLVLATVCRLWQSPTNAGWFALAGSLELLTVSSVLLVGRSLPALAIANIALGCLSQIAPLLRSPQSLPPSSSPPPDALRLAAVESPYPFSWHFIPLTYGLIALWFSHSSFTVTTGLYTLAVAVLGCQVGRRSLHLRPITYLSLVGVSLGAFELLIYQLAQARGGNPGDGLVLLAGLAIGLAWGYYGGQSLLVAHLRLPIPAFAQFTQAHWGLGSGLLVMAAITSLSRRGQEGWTVIVLLLAFYALAMGHTRIMQHRTVPRWSLPIWTVAGIGQLLAAIASGLWLWLPTPTLLDWAGVIAVSVAVSFYVAPWHHWGWARSPWQQTAIALPTGVILLTGWAANVQSLLVTAAFYVWLASRTQNIRFSYLGVLFADWALIRMLFHFNVTQPLWYAAISGMSLLYLAQVDPGLQQRYDQRHWLRSLATGLICLTGFYQAESGIPGVLPIVAGFAAIAIEFGFIVLGLLQQVRAFLYVGTLTFILQILWQLWRFIRDYSLLLWIVGIVVGLILIWVAATFEARRTQANTLLQHWVTELEDWQ